MASGWVIVACSGKPGTTPEEPGDTAAAVEEESLPDPGPEEATEVEDFVRQWVTERAGDGNVYQIPPSAGHDVAGALAAFHTVHQKNADTYSVCVDFQDGENTYDVDFFVDRTTEGLSVSDHYLHKINGEAVE
ncbi:MAG: hypothetical protein ACYS0K_24990 [Planctomycetota bacterium]